MANEKSKQIAPAVVLAQHGNKSAYRDIYIHYFKNIFFICSKMTGDAPLAMELTEEIFVKMFESVSKLEDHMAFEQWFYSLAVNLCRRHAPEGSLNSELSPETVVLAEKALSALEARDRFAFERGIVKVLENIIEELPPEAKVVLFYSRFAELSPEKIALLEKLELQAAEKEVDAISLILSKKTDKLRELGLDISGFTANMESTLACLAAKTFVPDGLHNSVSEKLGVDVNPFAPSPKEKEEAVEQAKTEVITETEKKREKKTVLTKSDIILFFSVVAAVLVIFTVIKAYDSSKNKAPTTSSTSAVAEKSPILWNGAAAGSFDGGDGTKESPYQIATGGQLAYLANLINDGNRYYSTCYYILTADIILNETDNYNGWESVAPKRSWTPIGSAETAVEFSGELNGNDHSITGMYIKSEGEGLGLFSALTNGRVRNLAIDYAYIEGGSYCGGIAGSISATEGSVTVDYCSFSGIIISSGSHAGGIAGSASSTDDAELNIRYCSSSGSIQAAEYAGGICGSNLARSGNSRINNCYSLATVSAETAAGGIVGENRADATAASVRYCYSVGTVSGESAGMIAGINSALGEGNAEITLSYWLETGAIGVTGSAEGGAHSVIQSVAALSAEEMRSAESFSGFDFSEIWEIGSGDYLYPVLQNMEFNPLTETATA